MANITMVKRKIVFIMAIALTLSVMLCFANTLLAQNPSSRPTFDQLKESYNKKDIGMYKKYITKKSVEMVEQMIKAGWGYEMPSDIIFVSESKNKEKAIIKCKEIDKDGNKKETDYIFVIEDAVWKHDVVATMEKMFKGIENSELTSSTSSYEDESGFVDITILDIKVNPDPPIAGDKETKIEARIKNLGTIPLKETLNYKYRINKWEQAGSFAGVIKPGEIVRLTIPYNFYLSMTGDDSPGGKDIYCEINYDDKINDKNKQNNSMKQTIKFVK